MNCCDFGENFKKLRKSRNITQKEFATHSSTIVAVCILYILFLTFVLKYACLDAYVQSLTSVPVSILVSSALFSLFPPPSVF